MPALQRLTGADVAKIRASPFATHKRGGVLQKAGSASTCIVGGDRRPGAPCLIHFHITDLLGMTAYAAIGDEDKLTFLRIFAESRRARKRSVVPLYVQRRYYRHKESEDQIEHKGCEEEFFMVVEKFHLTICFKVESFCRLPDVSGTSLRQRNGSETGSLCRRRFCCCRACNGLFPGEDARAFYHPVEIITEDKVGDPHEAAANSSPEPVRRHENNTVDKGF